MGIENADFPYGTEKFPKGDGMKIEEVGNPEDVNNDKVKELPERNLEKKEENVADKKRKGEEAGKGKLFDEEG